jgi:hypothetical protein
MFTPGRPVPSVEDVTFPLIIPAWEKAAKEQTAVRKSIAIALTMYPRSKLINFLI